MVIPEQKGHEMTSCACVERAGTLVRVLNAVHAAKGFVAYMRTFSLTAGSMTLIPALCTGIRL